MLLRDVPAFARVQVLDFGSVEESGSDSFFVDDVAAIWTGGKQARSVIPQVRPIPVLGHQVDDRRPVWLFTVQGFHRLPLREDLRVRMCLEYCRLRDSLLSYLRERGQSCH